MSNEVSSEPNPGPVRPAGNDRSQPDRPRKRRRLWKVVAVVGLLFLAAWFGQVPFISWAVGEAVTRFAPSAGLSVSFGRLEAGLFRSLVVDSLRVRVVDPTGSETDVSCGRLEVRFESFWRLVRYGDRLLAALEIDGLGGTLDFTKGAMPPLPPFPDLTLAEQEKVSADLLRILPETLRIGGSDLLVLADGQTYRLNGVNGDFDEFSAGRLTVDSATIQIGGVRHEFQDGEAITAWKNGVLYLFDLALRDGVTVRTFVVDLVHVGGTELEWDLQILDGTIRGNLAFNYLEGALRIDAAVGIFNQDLSPVPGLIGRHGVDAGGVIQDARVTFRGNPEELEDSAVSLRLGAGDLRWGDVAVESLEAGANYVGRRLYLSNFELRQSANRIKANGEFALPEDWSNLPRSHFLVNVSAEIEDLGSLAALAGLGADSVEGRVDLHGSVSGVDGEFSGYLNAEASKVAYANFPAASAKLSLVAADGDLQVKFAELWSGEDRIEAEGSVRIAAPHPYAGKASLRINDIGRYTPHVSEEAAMTIFTGAVDGSWEGDGTLNSHSGAFEIGLKNAITAWTPSGLTGNLAATYSPENIYFRTFRLEQGGLVAQSQVTFSASGCNITDLAITGGGTELLQGEAFFPVNLFAVAAGEDLVDAINFERPVYATIASRELLVGDLLQLAGQDVLLSGTVRLDLSARGPLNSLDLTGSFEARNLVGVARDFPMPSTSINLALATTDGLAVIDGDLRTRGFDPLVLSAELPFAFEKTAEGEINWFHADSPFSASVVFPRTGMEILRAFVPNARRLRGVFSGSIAAGGTLSAPELAGRIELRGGDVELSPELPAFTGMEALVTMSASRIVLESFRGEVGAGPFEITGAADISNPENPEITVAIRGEQVLLMRDPGLRLRANLDLRGSGTLESTAVTGSVDLMDGRIYRRLEITPLLVPSPLDDELFVPPVITNLVPDPLASWPLDVSIRNGNPFLLVGNLASGSINPDLKISGTLGDPVVTGTIFLTDLEAYLPATTLRIPEGRIHLTRANPLMPIMDVRARTRTSGYDIQLYAYGPLNEANFAIRSDPPMSQENLIALLATGVAPVGMAGAGLGGVAVGQGSILLLRSLARQLEPLGVNINEFVDRLTVSANPDNQTSRDGRLNADFRLTDGLSATAGQDSDGFFNAGMQYTIRFR